MFQLKHLLVCMQSPRQPSALLIKPSAFINVNVFGNSLDIDPVDELGTERPQDLTHSCHGTFLQLRISLWHLKAFKC